MPDQTTTEIVSLWDFSCNIYSSAGVQEACLYLQENHRVDIPLTLFACWAGYYFSPLNDEQLQRAQTVSAHWSLHCIQPLRSIRQSMKVRVGKAPEGWEGIREQVKVTELNAEEQLLYALESLTYTLFQAHYLKSDHANQKRVLTVTHYLQYFFPHINAYLGTRHEALTTILQAVVEDMPKKQLHRLLLDGLSANNNQ